jgi:hypothetical protein
MGGCTARRTGRRRRAGRTRVSLGVAVGVLVLLAGAAKSTDRHQKVTVTHRYDVGPIHAWLLGENWRRVWSEPVEVEVLDLAATGGGLRPVRTVGSRQTLGLALEGADGRSYTFRGLEKSGHGILPAFLRYGLLAALLRDQASENLPAADLLAAELSRQLGVRITRRRLVSMPDDPALGEFREAFAGAVGTFSEYPEPGPGGAPGTFGATEIVDSERLWQEVRSGKGASVDARAHLRARLIDWWIGDWDRHPEQWRWGLVDPSKRYVPLPEDHDHAFSHADGVLVLAAVRPLFPWIGPWDDDPSLRGMTFTSWWLDAWILAGLDRGDWLEEITAFEASIGPEVVEEALARFPRSWRALVGDEIRALLRARGAVLQRYALDVYASLSRIVHLYGSEADDRMEVDCLDGRVAVTLQAASGPRLRRVFLPGETERIVLHRLGGEDSIHRTGKAQCPIEIRTQESVRRQRGIPAPIDRIHDPRRPGRSAIEPRFPVNADTR